MNKSNKAKILTAVIISAMLLTACGAAKTDTNSSAAKAQETVTEYTLKDGDTQVTGQVTAVVGNEITIDLGSIKSKPSAEDSSASTDEEAEDSAASTDEENETPHFGNGERPSFANGEKPQMPDGASGEMPQNFDRDSKGNKGNGGSSVSMEKTGESESYVIPVGMSVTGGTGRNGDYSSISVGAAVKITLNADGEVVAVEIM